MSLARGIGEFIEGGFRGHAYAENMKSKKKGEERQARLDKIAEDQLARDNSRADTRMKWDGQNQDFVMSERARVQDDRDFQIDTAKEAANRTDAAMSAAPAPQARGTGVVAGAKGNDTLAGDAGDDMLRTQRQGYFPPTMGASDLNTPAMRTALGADRPSPWTIDPNSGPSSPMNTGSPLSRGSLPPPKHEPAQHPNAQALTTMGADVSSIPAPQGVDPLSAADQARRNALPMDSGSPLARGVLPSDEGKAPAGTKAERQQLGRDTIAVLAQTADAPSAATTQATIVDKPEPRGTPKGNTLITADKTGKSWMDHYMTTGAPYVAEQLARRGMVNEALQYQTWIDSSEAKSGMEAYGRAAFYASNGDMEGFQKSVLDIYNNEEYFPDGLSIDPSKSSIDFDDDGGGAEVTFVDGNGQEFVQKWESLDDLVMDTLNMLAPEKAFELRLGQMGAASEKRVDEAQRDADFDDFVKREMVKNGFKQDDVTRVSKTAEALATELFAADPPWSSMSDQDKMAAVAQRIALEDQTAAQISGQGGSAPTPAAAPQVMRRP